MFTEIEKIYIEKTNINLKDLNLEERMELRKKAYDWAFKKRKRYIGNVLSDKDSFLLFLQEKEI